MPLVPTTGSSTMAATLLGPSKASTSSRWASARSPSSATEVDQNEERYGYGPRNFT